jgi:sorbitol-specific phosphotransferase system component IIA
VGAEAKTTLTKLGGVTGRIARDGAIWAVHPRGNVHVADTVIFAEKLVIPGAAR